MHIISQDFPVFSIAAGRIRVSGNEPPVMNGSFLFWPLRRARTSGGWAAKSAWWVAVAIVVLTRPLAGWWGLLLLVVPLISISAVRANGTA